MSSIDRQASFTISVKSLNSHLTCALCKGYLVDATAIVECLHTFCRSCIVKYVQTDANRERCPTCNVIIKEAQPMAGLRPDRTLQDIVDKLLPQVREEEERRRELFVATRHLEGKIKYSKIPSTRNSPVMRILPPSDEDKVSLLLKPEDPKNLFGELHFEKHLRCSARMTVAHLKKFLAAKSNWKLENIQQIDIFCKGQPLRDELTLEFIWRIRWGNTRQTMVLEYGHRRERASSPDSPAPEKQRRRGRKRRLRKENLVVSAAAASESSPAALDGGENGTDGSPGDAEMTETPSEQPKETVEEANDRENDEEKEKTNIMI
ncbi:polycomb group RING finger protein 3-like [Oscarella lobularis]|uniref:polycomb group RING finger protein 3-like n=1 Tax=Oscarella lobularis TaxID=121494 RepID=UPI003313E6DF